MVATELAAKLRPVWCCLGDNGEDLLLLVAVFALEGTGGRMDSSSSEKREGGMYCCCLSFWGRGG